MPDPSDRRPRLLIVVTHPVTALNLMRGQLRFLGEQGYEVAVASAPAPELEAVARQEGVATFAVPFEREVSPFKDFVALFQLVGVVRRFAPRVVSASTPKAGLLGMLAARIARAPRRLLTIRGLRLETTRGLTRRILIGARRLAARSAHRVLCVSPSLLELAGELGLAPPEKLALLGGGSSNGIDVERFTAARHEIEALRSELSLPAGCAVVGFVGRLTRDKGVEDLAEAMAEVWLAAPETRLLLVGEFESGDPIAAAVRGGLDRDPRVLVTGWVADPAAYYGLMDVVAFPSYREGFPNLPLEAAAAGLPTVGYAATGTVDAIVDGVTGALAPVGDAAELARGLLRYLEDRALARSHGEAGRSWVSERFRREDVWLAWLREYERLTRE